MAGPAEHDNDTAAAATGPAPAAMIANRQPHTVSLPAGSNVAARKSARKPGPAEPAPPPRARASVKDQSAEPAAARAALPKAAARSPRKAEPAPAPAAAPQPVLGDAIVRRIAAVQALNDDARAVLARLGEA